MYGQRDSDDYVYQSVCPQHYLGRQEDLRSVARLPVVNYELCRRKASALHMDSFTVATVRTSFNHAPYGSRKAKRDTAGYHETEQDVFFNNAPASISHENLDGNCYQGCK